MRVRAPRARGARHRAVSDRVGRVLASPLVTARLLAHLTLCTALLALLPGTDPRAGAELDDCCAGERAVEQEADEPGHSSECPPGCDEGCACCAGVSALPTSSSLAVAVGDSVDLPPQRSEHEPHLERAPPSPDPRDRDVVPRAAFRL